MLYFVCNFLTIVYNFIVIIIITIIIIFVVVAVLYSVDEADLCLEAKLEQFSHGVDMFDVIINHSPVFPLETFYLPYVGA